MHTASHTPRPRGERLELRVSHDVKALCQKAAALEGRSLTDFVIGSTAKAAREVLRDHALLDLSLEDRRAFAEALLQPAAEPNEKLRKTGARHKKMVKEENSPSLTRKGRFLAHKGKVENPIDIVDTINQMREDRIHHIAGKFIAL